MKTEGIYNAAWKKELFEEIKAKHSDEEPTLVEFGVFKEESYFIRGYHPSDIEREIRKENFVIVGHDWCEKSIRLSKLGIELSLDENSEDSLKFKACSDGFQKVEVEQLVKESFGYYLHYKYGDAFVHRNCIAWDKQMVEKALENQDLTVFAWITKKQGGIPIAGQVSLEIMDLEAENDKAFGELGNGY